MLEYRLRAATAADEPFIRRLVLETSWEFLPEDVRGRLTRSEITAALEATHAALRGGEAGRLVIAEDAAGNRAGLLWVGASRNLVTGEDELWIYHLGVVPEHRRRGLGRYLLAHAEQLAREAGYPAVTLMVAEGNEPARQLYASEGFRPAAAVLRKPLP